MSSKTNKDVNNDSFIDEESSLCEEEVNYNNGRWSEEEHRRFLEATALYGSKWEKVKEHVQTRSARQIRSHAQKFIMRLSKKKSFNTKRVNILELPIAFEEYQKLSKKELESILMSKYGNNKNFDTESKEGKKYFIIEKYPRYRTLKEMINNRDKNPFDFIGNFLGGEEKESEVKKKLVEEILKENINEESNTKKMEELRKMSEVLQILNKTKNKENTDEKTFCSDKSSVKVQPTVKTSDNKETISTVKNKDNTNNSQNIQNYFTSVNYNIVNHNLNNVYANQSAQIEEMISQAQNNFLLSLQNQINSYQNFTFNPMINYQMFYPFGAMQFYPFHMNSINSYQYPNVNNNSTNNNNNA